MKLRRLTGLLLGAMALGLLSGCGVPKITLPDLIKATPTPLPTRAPTPTPPKPSPLPTLTPTPAPRQLGIRNGSAGSVQLSNGTGMRFRQFYLQAVGGNGWGRNLIPPENSIHVGETFAFFYPQAAQGRFNLLFNDENGMGFELYDVQLSDMASGILQYDSRAGEMYIAYMSLSSLKRTDTRDAQSQDVYGQEEDEEEYDYEMDIESYEDEMDEEEEEEDAVDRDESYTTSDEMLLDPFNRPSFEEDDDEQWDYILR